MIQTRSMLKVADNTGAKLVQVIKVLGGTRRRYGQIGDIIIASVQIAEPRKNVKKKDIVKVLIVRQRKPTRRSDGTYVRFDDNAVVLVDDKREPIATRVFGPLPRELKEKGFEKLITMAEEIV